LTGAKYQPKPIVLATCNPTHGWVKELIYDRWKIGSLPVRWKYIPAKITDNVDKDGKLNLPQAYIDNLSNLPIFEYMVFVEGNWDIQLKTGGEFYKCFNIASQIKTLKYDPNIALHLSFDFNVNPYMTCTVWQIQSKKAMQIGEICTKSPNNTTKGICNEVKRQYQGHNSGCFIYGDPSGSKEDTRTEKGFNDYTIIRTELTDFKPSMRVQGKAPSVVMRGNFINTIFSSEYDGIKVEIDSRCTNTLNDYLYLKEDSDGTKKKEHGKDPATGISFEKYGHTSDANDYFLCTAFANEYIKYQRGGKNTVPTIGRNVSKNSYV
jgi:hypothetical protein